MTQNPDQTPIAIIYDLAVNTLAHKKVELISFSALRLLVENDQNEGSLSHFDDPNVEAALELIKLSLFELYTTIDFDFSFIVPNCSDN